MEKDGFFTHRMTNNKECSIMDTGIMEKELIRENYDGRMGINMKGNGKMTDQAWEKFNLTAKFSKAISDMIQTAMALCKKYCIDFDSNTTKLKLLLEL